MDFLRDLTILETREDKDKDELATVVNNQRTFLIISEKKFGSVVPQTKPRENQNNEKAKTSKDSMASKFS